MIGAGPTLNLEAPPLFARAEAIRTTAKIRQPNLRAPWALMKLPLGVLPSHVIKFPAPTSPATLNPWQHGHSDFLRHALLVPCLSRPAGLTLDPIPCNYANTSAQGTFIGPAQSYTLNHV